MRRFSFALAALGACSNNGSSAPATAQAATADAGTCPVASAPTVAGAIASSAIDEASGIVASALNPGVYWTHNDSGDSARGFALSSTGQLLAILNFDTAEPIDIEDVAIEDTAAGSFLYFADIGDNSANRADVVIHRVAEPKLGMTPGQTLTATSQKMHVTYASGPNDAETLLFDPRTKDLFIVSKLLFGNASVHRVGPFVAGARVTTTRVGGVPVVLATGGDITRAGDLIAIRNYTTTALAWLRGPNDDIATALSRPACSLPVASEHQGEAFGFLPDGTGYVTTSEGTNPPLDVATLR